MIIFRIMFTVMGGLRGGGASEYQFIFGAPPTAAWLRRIAYCAHVKWTPKEKTVSFFASSTPNDGSVFFGSFEVVLTKALLYASTLRQQSLVLFFPAKTCVGSIVCRTCK